MVIFNSEVAKGARVAVGLSQARAASLADISRTYLSQFENGRLVLQDDQSDRLRRLYEEHGYEFVDENEDDASTDAGLPHQYCRLVDGIAVPVAVGDDEADEIMSEYAENASRIRELCGLSAGFFDWGAEEQKREAVALMLRNYALVESLQGRGSILDCADDGAETVGTLIVQEVAQFVPVKSDPPGLDALPQ